jgi:hypothetical protein
MTPKDNLLLNWQQKQEVRQRRPIETIQLRRIVIDREAINRDGIKNPPKPKSNRPISFAQGGRCYIRSITTCLMIFLPKKITTKKYQHGEFPL